MSGFRLIGVMGAVFVLVEIWGGWVTAQEQAPVPLPQETQEPLPKPLPQEVVDAWKKAGAIVGWTERRGVPPVLFSYWWGGEGRGVAGVLFLVLEAWGVASPAGNRRCLLG